MTHALCNKSLRLVCLYAYYEKNQLYTENLKFFIKHVIEKKPSDIDFFIIINGECSLKTFPEDVKIIKRENKGFDFGAYSHCISNHIQKQYDYYIFLNTCIRGPFPTDVDWKSKFLALFSKPDVRLVGTTICMWYGGLNHVQSMFFILDKEGFSYLQEAKFFDEKDPVYQSENENDIIFQKEIRMSTLILEKGWNINAILWHYRDLDYRRLKFDINPTGPDPYYPESLWGKSIRPEDVIFFKTNRSIPFDRHYGLTTP